MTQDRRWANRRVNRETDAHQARGLWLRSLLLILALLPGGVWLWKQTRCVSLSYDVQQLRDRHEHLLETERRLRAERAEAASLDRIEHWAGRGGDLVRPATDDVVVVRPGADETTDDHLVARGRE